MRHQFGSRGLKVPDPLRIGTPFARTRLTDSTLWPGSPPPTKIQMAARAFVRAAGWICESRAREWWADLIFVQEEHDDWGLGRAVWCVLSAPGLAWPDLRLRFVSATAEFLIEVAFSGLRAIAFVTLGMVRWSPGAIGAGVGMSLGLLMPPISGVAALNLAWSVGLAIGGLYLGKAFPEGVLRTVLPAGGAVCGIGLGAYVAGSMSIPLFAAPGMILGSAMGSALSALASKLDVVTATEVAARAMNTAIDTMRRVMSELTFLSERVGRRLGVALGMRTHGTEPSTSRKLTHGRATLLLSLSTASASVSDFMIRAPERSATQAELHSASPIEIGRSRLPASTRRRPRRNKRQTRLPDP